MMMINKYKIVTKIKINQKNKFNNLKDFFVINYKKVLMMMKNLIKIIKSCIRRKNNR
jgi:hypothetical protein